MSLFANEIQDDKPICPECKEACEPNGENVAANNSTGMWIMHAVCMFKHNERILSDDTG